VSIGHIKPKKGDLTDKVFTVGDQYIITRLSQIKPKGILPLDAVKKQIETCSTQ